MQTCSSPSNPLSTPLVGEVVDWKFCKIGSEQVWGGNVGRYVLLVIIALAKMNYGSDKS